MKNTILKIAAASVALGLAFGAIAQGYPTKPINLIVGTAPGGGYDLVARRLEKAMAKNLGQSMVVTNRPGSGSLVASVRLPRRTPGSEGPRTSFVPGSTCHSARDGRRAAASPSRTGARGDRTCSPCVADASRPSSRSSSRWHSSRSRRAASSPPTRITRPAATSSFEKRRRRHPPRR